jgi:hypothetical protein
MVLLALLLMAQVNAPPGTSPGAPPSPPPSAPLVVKEPDTLVVVDDRATKDQAPPAFIDRVVSELGKRKGLAIERMSTARKRLDEREDRALTTCGDNAGCLATAGREMGARIVVFARLTKRDGAFFVAITRVNALRPQASSDEGTLAGTDADALAAIPEAISELFAEVELKSP